jgi:hypothetical protein
MGIKTFFEELGTEGLNSSYDRNISPSVDRAYHSFSENIVQPLKNNILDPAYIAISAAMTWIQAHVFTPIFNNIINPVIQVPKNIYNWLKASIFTPFAQYLTASLTAIYAYIGSMPSFNYIYDLLQLEHTWPTDPNKFEDYKVIDNTTRLSANMAHSIAWTMFIALAAVPAMLMLVGSPGNHLFTIGCILLYSFAVGISFTATVLHNSKNNPEKTAITAIIFTSIIMLGLIYINLTTGALLINIASAIIGFSSICFALAHQPDMKDQDFIKRFNSKLFIPSYESIPTHESIPTRAGDLLLQASTNPFQDPAAAATVSDPSQQAASNP